MRLVLQSRRVLNNSNNTGQMLTSGIPTFQVMSVLVGHVRA